MTLVLVTLKLMFTLPIQDGGSKSLKGDFCVVENTSTHRLTHKENLKIDKIHLTNKNPISCIPLRVNLGNISLVVIIAKIY